MMDFFGLFRLLSERLRSNACPFFLFFFSVATALQVQASTCAIEVQEKGDGQKESLPLISQASMEANFPKEDRREFQHLLKRMNIVTRGGIIRPEVDVTSHYLNRLSSQQFSELFTGNIMENEGLIHFGAKVREIGIDVQHTWDSNGLLQSSNVVAPHVRVSLFTFESDTKISGSITFLRENVWADLHEEGPTEFRVNSNIAFDVPRGFKLATYLVEEPESNKLENGSLTLTLFFRRMVINQSLLANIGEVVEKAFRAGSSRISTSSMQEYYQRTLEFKIQGVDTRKGDSK